MLMASSAYAHTIKTVKFNGLDNLSEGVALRMLGFNIGEVSDKQIDESVKKFYKQGYFNDIWVELKDGVLTYNFVEKPRISKVELKGWKESDDDIKKNVVAIPIGSMYDEAKIESAKKRIIETIEQDGKIDTVVEVKKELLENGSIKLTFLVNEGHTIIIDKVEYSGVEKLDASSFDDAIANKEREFMGWLWGRNDGKMRLSDLEYDPLRIKDQYMQHGYLDAEVKEPFVKANFDNYTANMSYQVSEGEQYTISDIEIIQESSVVEDELIREQLHLEVGKAFNVETFRKDADRIKTLIADKSYAYVQVLPDLDKNKTDKTVKVIMKVIPGERVKIRDVVISGNTRTLDRIIRRELFLGPNDMYSKTDLEDSKNALGRLGFFDSNTIEEKRVDEQTMDLIVKVKEAPTGNIQIGGGYGSYGGLLLSVGVDDRNIWGSGIDVGVRAERSEYSHDYSFNIANSRLNDSDFSGDFSIFTSNFEYNDYKVATDGLGVGIGHRFTRYISGSIGYSFSKNSYKYSDEMSSLPDKQFFQNYTKSSISLNATYDDTDDYYVPRSGIVLSQTFEKAGIGAKANFLKSRTYFAGYKGLDEWVGFDLIARYKARGSYIKDTGFVPIAERLYMGGIGSVRGFESYSISPLVKDDPSASDGFRRYGGEYSASNSFELSFPLVPKAKMRLVTYVDWGFIGTKEEGDRADGFRAETMSRGGYGMGLEWFSPVGPIQLMFSQPISEKKGDKTAVFEFTMGQRF